MRVFVTEKFLFIKEKLYAQFFGAVEIFFLNECFNSRFEFSYDHFNRFLLGYNFECDNRDLQ